MIFHSLTTRNWSRTYTIWIDGIQVCFKPVVDLERRIIKGGLLRKVRRLTPLASGMVALFFTIHCTNPHCITRNADPSPAHTASEKENGSTSQPRAEKSGPVQYKETGIASWYGSIRMEPEAPPLFVGVQEGCSSIQDPFNQEGEEADKPFTFEGALTANGEIYDSSKLTCAHKTLPFGTLVEVHNPKTRKKVLLRVNDRGPYAKGRILDVTRQASIVLGFLEKGVAKVNISAFDRKGRPLMVHAVEKSPLIISRSASSALPELLALNHALDTKVKAAGLLLARTKPSTSMHRVRPGLYANAGAAGNSQENLAKRQAYSHVDPFIRRWV